MPSLKSDELLQLEKRYAVWTFFQSYYQGELLADEEQWLQAMTSLAHCLTSTRDPRINTGLAMVKTAAASGEKDAIYDFNRLFVGPGKLLAPPYESAYRNPDGLLMQEQTLAVRKFYRDAGLEVSAKGSQPDDHLQLESEFVRYLLWQQGMALAQDDEETGLYYQQLYRRFFKTHLANWLFRHCEDILENSTTKTCRGIAFIMLGFLEMERDLLN